MLAKARDGVRLVRTVVFLRAKRVRHGPLPVCRGRLPIVGNAGRITVGRAFRTRSFQARIDIATAPGAELVLGDRVFVNQGATIYAARSVRIGNDVRFADHAAVYDTDFHPVSPGETRTAPVVIGDNVWLGRGAMVLPGVTVGRHSVVAAGAVVTRDVPERSVVAGNPAVVVRTFDCPDDWVRS